MKHCISLASLFWACIFVACELDNNPPSVPVSNLHPTEIVGPTASVSSVSTQTANLAVVTRSLPTATVDAIRSTVTVAISTTITPKPVKAPTKVFFYVGKTGGEGVYVRKTPRLADRHRAYADKTRLMVIGSDVEAEGRIWKHVRAPDGTEGYVPVEYTVQDLSPPTTAVVSVTSPAPSHTSGRPITRPGRSNPTAAWTASAPRVVGTPAPVKRTELISTSVPRPAISTAMILPTPGVVARPTLPTGNAARAFNARVYTVWGDAYNCVDFSSQASAQAVLRAAPNDPNQLDTDQDGVACRNQPTPHDLTPVPR